MKQTIRSDIELSWRRHPSSLLRLAGEHPPVGEVQEQVQAQTHLPVRTCSISTHADDDYAQIEPALPLFRVETETPAPAPGVGYAGLTADQRAFFHDWLLDPTQPGAPAYQRLYMAQLEVGLLDTGVESHTIQEEILRLLSTDAWQASDDLLRVGLLAGWLAQDGPFLAAVLARSDANAVLLGVGLGWQALLGEPLTGPELQTIRRAWISPARDDRSLDPELLQLNLDSLTAALGMDPLQYALDALLATQPTPPDPQEEASEDPQADASETPVEPRAWERWRGEWTPWRAVHRQLRLVAPQPNLRPHLEPLLAQLFRDAAATHPQPDVAETTRFDGPTADEPQTPAWYLVLEFGESRSRYYDYVVHQARKQPGYQLLMDETRQIVHRILFRKGQMRHFWRLWEYVQNWSSTKVYRNGEELASWKIWPYSQYLR